MSDEGERMSDLSTPSASLVPLSQRDSFERMSDYDLRLPANYIISSFCGPFSISFLKQGFQVLLHNG